MNVVILVHFSGFKQELYGYLLGYTRKLLVTIVEARDGDPDAKELVQLVKNHTLGLDKELGKEKNVFSISIVVEQ